MQSFAFKWGRGSLELSPTLCHCTEGSCAGVLLSLRQQAGPHFPEDERLQGSALQSEWHPAHMRCGQAASGAFPDHNGAAGPLTAWPPGDCIARDPVPAVLRRRCVTCRARVLGLPRGGGAAGVCTALPLIRIGRRFTSRRPTADRQGGRSGRSEPGSGASAPPWTATAGRCHRFSEGGGGFWLRRAGS